MTSEFNRYLDRFNELELASPEIEEASSKIVTFDRYNSEGGSESESRDYFEIQRLLEALDDTVEIVPPKTPLRSDYELMSDSICYYLKKKQQHRIEIKSLQGFLLSETLSEGDIKQIGNTICEDGSQLISTNGGKYFVYFSGLRDELLSRISGNALEELKEIIGSESPSLKDIEEDGSAGNLSLADKLVAQYQAGGLGRRQTTDSSITNLRELRSFLSENLMKGIEIPASDDEVDEIIEALASV